MAQGAPLLSVLCCVSAEVSLPKTPLVPLTLVQLQHDRCVTDNFSIVEMEAAQSSQRTWLSILGPCSWLQNVQVYLSWVSAPELEMSQKKGGQMFSINDKC